MTRSDSLPITASSAAVATASGTSSRPSSTDTKNAPNLGQRIPHRHRWRPLLPPPILLFASLLIAHLLTFAPTPARADEHSHTYASTEQLVVWANTVGPIANAAETYPFYSLPYCRGTNTSINHRHESLSEALLGLDLVNTGMKLAFRKDVPQAPLCSMDLGRDKVDRFAAAVRQGYRFELVVDELPVYGWVGRVDASERLPGRLVRVVDQADVPEVKPVGEVVPTHGKRMPVPPPPIPAPAGSNSSAGSSGGAANRKAPEVVHSNVPDVPAVAAELVQDPTPTPLALYTHFAFRISFNENQIIHVNLTTSNPVPLDTTARSAATAAPLSVNLTYSVVFVPTEIPFARRFDKYLDTEFFNHKIHWFSIVNSFLLCVVLIGAVAFIMVRSLRRDMARYDNLDIYDLDRDFDFDYGWKQIHGDVFRAPPNLGALAALLGNGIQLFLLILIALLFSLIDASYQDFADAVTAAIVIYSLTAVLNGFISTGYYCKYGGRHWLKHALTASLVVPIGAGSVLLAVNLVASAYGSSKAVAFGSIMALAAIFVLLIIPLTLVGGYLGHRRYSGVPRMYRSPSASRILLAGLAPQGFPTRINPIPRPIPERTWHTHPFVLIAAGGVLPFVSVYMELYFVLTSAAGLKVYYVYGFGLLAMVLLACNAACCAIVVAYWLINAEDHRWHWVTFNAAGSTAAWVFLYAGYFYFARTQMHGLFQFMFFFGNSLVLSFSAYLVLGTIGHLAASKFMHHIYANVKID